MRLSRIEIENFKAIGKRQAIDLKPITLLFGPNSAGKSTILQALHYTREILERQNADPDQTIGGGPIDLGGFRALVHGHELAREISIKLVIDLSAEEGVGSETLPLNSGISFGDSRFANLAVRYMVAEDDFPKTHAMVQEVGVEVRVRWSDLLAGPYVSSLNIEMNRERLASITSPPQGRRAILTDFNFLHPLLLSLEDEDDVADEYYGSESSYTSPLSEEIWSLSREMASEPDLPPFEYRVAVATVAGALPDPNESLTLGLRDPDADSYELEESTPRVEGLAALLDELVLGPVRLVRETLRSMTYIGPLREIPMRGFRPQRSPDESRWAQGLAAWDLLHTDVKGSLIEEVNDWLLSEDKLRTGYRVEKVTFREVPVPSRISSLFDRGLTDDDIGELQELYDNLETRVDIGLRDWEQSILLSPSDVGIGISQMIPIVVGCLAGGVGLLVAEQPELHVHPAVQVGIGDLLIYAIGRRGSGIGGNRALLVETHSEHIMLRLLRRIRETAEGDLPPGAPSLRPDQLSVMYVESSVEGARFQPLRVDKDGEFIDRWPSGFFDERAEELF